MRRQSGTGAIFQDSRGLWTAVFELPRGPRSPRRQVRLRSTTREGLDAKRAPYVAAQQRPVAPARPRRPRSEAMLAARSGGTHTRAEWFAKVCRNRHLCSYCGRRCASGQYEKDHVVPVARGGSDAIDNLTPACRDCNRAKGDLTGPEFVTYMILTGQWS